MVWQNTIGYWPKKSEHERWHGDHGSVSVFTDEFTDLRARIKSQIKIYYSDKLLYYFGFSRGLDG